MSSKSTRSSSKSRNQTQQEAISGVRRKATDPGVLKRRRVSLRANAAATEALWQESGIAKASRKQVLTQAAARLDDVELDSAWQAAIRGDYIVASDRLQRTVKQTHMRQRKRRPKGWTPWRERLLARRP